MKPNPTRIYAKIPVYRAHQATGANRARAAPATALAAKNQHQATVTRRQYAEFSWAIESYHRGIKQCVGVERCQCRSGRAQRNHIGLALRAFLRLEAYCFARGVSWVEAKTAIIRDAVRAYLAKPHIQFPGQATA